METFSQTSSKLYDRHNYKLVLVDGSSKTFDNYHDVQAMWYEIANDSLSHIEVLDKHKGFN
jgi:hypothetical protein